MSPAPSANNKAQQSLLLITLMNGLHILAISALLAIGALWFRWWEGVIIAVAAAFSGAIELYGRRLILIGRDVGFTLLRVSQLWLLLVIAGFCFLHLADVTPDWIMNAMKQAGYLDTLYASAGDQLFLRAALARVLVFFYAMVLVAATLYQGGMWLFYRSTEKRIALAAGRRDAAGPDSSASPPAAMHPPLPPSLP